MFSTIMIFTASFICGILISPYMSLTMLAIFMAILLVFYSIIALLTKKFTLTAVIAIIICFLGGIRIYLGSGNKLYYTFPEKYVTVSGTVESSATKSYGEYKYRYILRADTLEYLDKKYKINEKILLKSDQNMNFGKYVCARGFLSEISGPKNELEYDYSRYYKSLGIRNRLTAYELTQLGETKSYYPSFIIGKFKDNIKNKIFSVYSGDDAALLCAVLLGDKSEFSSEYKTKLLQTGVLHTLYSPYAHISLIFLIASLFAFKDRQRYETIAVIFCILYAVCNSTSPNMVKSAYLAMLIIFSRKIYGFSDKLQVLSVIVFIMTLLDPNLCFNSGFMMSVISTVVVFTSYKPVQQILAPVFKKARIRSLRIKQLITVWLVLCVGTLPFSAYYFNGVSLYALLFSAPFLPFIFAVIISGIPFGLLGASALGQIVSFQQACLFVMKLIPEFIERLPFHYITLRTPSLLEIIIFYLIWIMVLRGIEKKDFTAKSMCVILLAFVICDITGKGINSLEIYFVNVGQGDGAVMHTFLRETVLIDGGGSPEYDTEYNIGEQVYLPYLISHGFTKINVAIVSHFHKDHVQGIIAAAENLKIHTIMMPQATPDNIYRKELEEIAKKRNIQIKYLHAGDIIKFDSGLILKVLAPSNEQLSDTDENDMSLVISAEYGKFTALFTGDSSTPLTNAYPKNIDLLKVAHHGSKTGSNQDFVTYTHPKYAVISVGENNSYNLPSPEVVKRFEDAGSNVIRTDEHGDIKFRASKKGLLSYRTFTGG